jgi:hypothetical protein
MVPALTALRPPGITAFPAVCFPLAWHYLQETPRMNPGDSVQDVSRTGPDEASALGAAGQSHGTLAQSPRFTEHLQDIQDIIDKLAAVTQELRRPGSGVAGPSN